MDRATVLVAVLLAAVLGVYTVLCLHGVITS